MFNMSMTTMSSKGQIVIPAEMRKNMKKGERLVLIQTNRGVLIEKATRVQKKMVEDLEFARRTEEAIRQIEAGNYRKLDLDKYLEELER